MKRVSRLRPSGRSGDWVIIAIALAASLPCLLLPVSNPDIFWHLSAGRRMIELGSIPAFDWLSSGDAGLPWTDFEWLTQLIYLGIHHALGMAGLWLFKGFLLAAAGGIIWKMLALYEVQPVTRAAGLAVWFAAQFARADIRPELYSIVGFASVFWMLEARRLGRRIPGPLWTLPLFSLWTNLHLGSVFGLILILFYAVGDSFRRVKALRGDAAPLAEDHESLWWYALSALAGIFVQPFGWKIFQVLWSHWVDMGAMRELISEWRPIDLGNPWHWPYFGILFTAFAAALFVVVKKRSVAFGPLLSIFYFGNAASGHARLAGYFTTVAVPLTLYWIKSSKPFAQRSPRSARLATAGAVAICAVYSIAVGRGFGVGKRVFNDRFLPVASTEFLMQEKDVLSRLTMYNEWGWGGYLGYKLFPEYRIFQDGRYIFHPLLREAGEAIASPPESWQEFLDRYGVQLSLMENLPLRLPTTRIYPDGTPREFSRPYYVTFMPKERWALVHWDRRALVFVRRDAISPKWLRAHEYRFFKPGDDEALADAVRRKEVRQADVDAEFGRHEAESATPRRTPDL